MIEFLKTDYVYHLEILAAIIASLSYKWYNNSPNKYFLWFLWITVIIETIGLIPLLNYYYPDFFKDVKTLALEGIIENNDWLYNIYWMFFFPFYFFYYKLIIKRDIFKKLVLLFLGIYLIITLIDLFFNISDFNATFLKTSRVGGSVLFFITATLYFYEVVNSNQIFRFHLTLTFWITTGTLFFVLVTSPVYIFSDLTYDSDKFHNFFIWIHKISNYVLYGCFIIGFIINAYQQRKKGLHTKIT